jgi:hypothetical protein
MCLSTSIQKRGVNIDVLIREQEYRKLNMHHVPADGIVSNGILSVKHEI